MSSRNARRCSPCLIPYCEVGRFVYVVTVDWQQITTLMIVALTAAIMVRERFRSRAATLGGPGCGGCCTASHHGTPPTIILRARKGQRPRMMVRA